VIRVNKLPTPLVWIEHWPEESTQGQETFELVVFSSYEVVEEGALLWGDEAMVRGCYMEAAGPRYCGGVGG